MKGKEWNQLIKEAGKLAIQKMEKESLSYLHEDSLRHLPKTKESGRKTVKSVNKAVDNNSKKC